MNPGYLRNLRWLRVIRTPVTLVGCVGLLVAGCSSQARLPDAPANGAHRTIRQGVLADLLKLEADQALTIHPYYAVGTQTTAFRNVVRGPTPGPAAQLVTAWNIHTWEMI